MNNATQIMMVNRPDHTLHNRPVLRIERCDGFSTVEMLEQQSLPSDQRRIAMFHDSVLSELSGDRQLQIASTMGLRLESLPY